MAKLFKPVPDEFRRSISIVLRLTHAESDKIRHSAKIRNLCVSEFIRRAALGRKADVRFETQTVLALHHFVQEIRRLYAAMVERGLTPPAEELATAINQAKEAMLRISD